MALINKLREPLKDYISLNKLLRHLSDTNNEPLHDVIAYLLHHNFDEMVGYYYIDENYHIEPLNHPDAGDTWHTLNEIRSILRSDFTYDKWIYRNDHTSLDELDTKARSELSSIMFQKKHIFYKKSELLMFEPFLNDNLLHFNSEQSISNISEARKNTDYQSSDYYAKFNNCENISNDFNYFTILEAALVWYGMSSEDIKRELPKCKPKGDNNEQTRNTFVHPYIQCVEIRCTVLHEAFNSNKLKMGRDGGISGFKDATNDPNDMVLGHISPSRRTIKISDLKEYIRAYHPDDMPKTLFSEIDNRKTPLITSEDYLSIKTEKETLEARLEKAKQIYFEQEELIEELKRKLSKTESSQLKNKRDITPLDKFNAERSQIISMGQSLAKYLWSMDTTQAIKTGDMVQQIKSVLLEVNSNLLPDDDAIREWLKDIAPDYAKQGGRPPKDAPKEISLLMKK